MPELTFSEPDKYAPFLLSQGIKRGVLGIISGQAWVDDGG